MTISIRRREFLAVLGGAVAHQREASAQVATRRPLVAWLAWGAQGGLPKRNIGLFLKGMGELHYTEGQNFEMVYRFADAHPDRLAKLATELVQLKPDVIVAQATIEGVAAREVTKAIPIVVPVLADPVELGFVTGDARPGGNVTGIAPYVKGLPAKQLELAREIVPGATRVGLLDDVTDPKAHPQRREIEAAGRELKISIVTAEVGAESDIQQAYDALSTERVEVVVVEQSTMLISAREKIATAGGSEKVTLGLWVPRACRGRRSYKLRGQSNLVLSPRCIL